MTNYDDYETEFSSPQIDFETTLATFRDLENQHSTAYNAIFYGLSGLSDTQIVQFEPVWNALHVTRRRSILEQIAEFSEANFEVNYGTIGRMALNDPDAAVRKVATDVLWEDESLATMSRLIELAQWDEARDVRAAAASALGRYILLGELGDLPEAETKRAQDVMMTLWTDTNEDIEVRRRALEAISNCSHDSVPDAIYEAYNSSEEPLQISAVFAMGRTCDSKRWGGIVLHSLDNALTEIRYEAARAAGELELADAVPRLRQLAQTDDIEIREAAIWSLGEIATKEARRALDQLAETAHDLGQDELIEAVEDAIANASFMGGDLPFMFDIDTDYEDDDEYDHPDNYDDQDA